MITSTLTTIRATGHRGELRSHSVSLANPELMIMIIMIMIMMSYEEGE